MTSLVDDSSSGKIPINGQIFLYADSLEAHTDSTGKATLDSKRLICYLETAAFGIMCLKWHEPSSLEQVSFINNLHITLHQDYWSNGITLPEWLALAAVECVRRHLNIDSVLFVDIFEDIENKEIQVWM
jgi:hypothetical protein